MEYFRKKIHKYILLGISVLSVFFAFPAYAHLKWFVESGQPAQAFSGNLVAYTSAWLLITLIVVLIGIVLDKLYPKISLAWEPKKIEPYATAIIGILLGTSLLINASQGGLFSVNINDVGSMHVTLLMLEGFIGLSLILGLAVRQAALLLVGLWLCVLYLSNTIDVLENTWVVGAALFLFFRGRTVLRYTHEDIFYSYDMTLSQAQAISFLRIFLGINLIILGFSEKIMYLQLGLHFLQEHPWNFMANLGVTWFTDELFVFSAGAVEIILGLFLVTGWVTRLTAVVLAGFFLTPPFFMGPEELVGHIPHLAMVVAVLVFGRGASLGDVFSTLNRKWNARDSHSAPLSSTKNT
ncbi:MAG: DoxX family membrane protein [Gammaproteobacteria bacterium]|nr:DoxX family membrane protein [Gammaproteobacteria bacterium]